MKIVIKEWLRYPKACFILFITFILGITHAVLNAQVMLVIKDAFENPQNITEYIIKVGCIYGTLIVTYALRGKLRQEAHHYTFTKVLDHFNDKILDGDVSMYTKYSPAHIQTVSEFTDRIVRVGTDTVRFVEDMLAMIVYIYYMYLVAGRMIIPVVIVYAIGSWCLKVLYSTFTKIDKEANRLKKRRNQEWEDCVNGFLEVRSYNKVEHHRKSLYGYNHDTYRMFSKRSNINSGIYGVIEVVDTIGVLMIMFYSAKMIIKGAMSAAEGVTVVGYALKLMGPLTCALDFIDELSMNLSLSEQFEEVMSYKNLIEDEGKIELSEFNDSIKINNLSFSYEGDSKNVLKGISMEIEKGQRIGICGISGGGKSTLFKLLNRFYDPQDGSIEVDGIDVRDISMESYRKMIGSVHQDNYIFPGTIKDNITYGVTSYTEEEFLSACRKANVYDFAMEQKDKFDTVVGPRGLKLSGGQKQRIALARLLLVNPEIILLDEATSALDNESEYLIQDAIDNLGDKTIISIAHRLSTIRNCDKIYVMGKNRIIEQGNHETLMSLDGEYARMIRLAEKKERRGA